MPPPGMIAPAPEHPLDDHGLYDVVYAELKRIARHARRSAGNQDTLCTTELVHEAFLRLSRVDASRWQSRVVFFATASRVMRCILVDFARRRQSAKRGGGWARVSLGHAESALDIELDHVLALDEALERLNELNPRLREVVELRFFAGMPERDIAEMLGVTTRTVERDWLKARLFLLEALGSRSGAI